MTSPTSLPIAVIGAGALGAATALALARTGAKVILIDGSPLGRNASGVAAGMLAPAMESALVDPAACLARVRAARAHIERDLSFERRLRRLEDLYDRLAREAS